MIRSLFRTYWRHKRQQPGYLQFSGSWDTIHEPGNIRPARFWNVRHWINAFRDEQFRLRFPEFDL